MDGFIGRSIDRSSERKINLNQIGLIDRILSVTDMEDYNYKFTPT